MLTYLRSALGSLPKPSRHIEHICHPAEITDVEFEQVEGATPIEHDVGTKRKGEILEGSISPELPQLVQVGSGREDALKHYLRKPLRMVHHTHLSEHHILEQCRECPHPLVAGGVNPSILCGREHKRHRGDPHPIAEGMILQFVAKRVGRSEHRPARARGNVWVHPWILGEFSC